MQRWMNRAWSDARPPRLTFVYSDAAAGSISAANLLADAPFAQIVHQDSSTFAANVVLGAHNQPLSACFRYIIL